MGQRKAFEIDRGDVRIGYLGEGRGPFVSARGAGSAGAMLEHVRFTSLSARDEKLVDDVLVRTTDFDAVLSELKARGFVLRPVTYREVFK